MAPSATSHLSPDDAAVAVRSFPRRFRALLARPADDEDRPDPDELARRIGPEGRSAVDHLLAADGVLVLLGRAIEVARGSGDPVLDPAVTDLRSAWWDDPDTPLAALLDQLGATATATAARMDGVDAAGWARHVRVADRDETRSLLDVARDVVDVAAGHLRAAERTVRAVG